MSTVARSPLPTRLTSPQGSTSVHLDALRGIAAVGVCLEHLRDIYFCDYSSIVHHSPLLALVYLASGLGHQWVMVFFVLSGYLVGGSVLRAHASGRWSWNGYLFNRLTRLYIVLAPAVAIGGLWDLFGIRLFGSNGIYGGHTGAHAFTVSVQTHMGILNLLGNYAFLQGIHVPSFGSNGPLWSLTNEFWYYIAFPPLVFAIVRSTSALRRVLYVAFLAALVWFVGHQIALLGLVWLMGVAIHYLPRIPVRSAMARGLMALAALACLAATLGWCKRTHSPLSDYVLGIAVTFLIYVVVNCPVSAAPGLYTRAARRLSHSSYTLYLVHVPLLVFLAAVLETRFSIVRWQPDPRHLLYGAGIFLLVLLYAQLVWFLFEKRTDGLRFHLRRTFKSLFGRAVAVPDPPQ